MNKYIIFSDGGKGGVGKSMTTISLTDYLLSANKRVYLIDSDVTNPEVYRLFNGHKRCPATTYDLREETDWMEFIVSLETLSDKTDFVIVNLPAAIDITKQLTQYHELFHEIGFNISVFFTINKQADSINLLGHSIKNGPMSFADHKVVVKNGIFGLEDDFLRFDDSDTLKELMNTGGHVIYIRELFHKSVDLCLLEHKKTFSEAVKETMPLLYRYQIQQWVRDVHDEFSNVFSDQHKPALDKAEG